MNDGAALIKAIITNPDEDTPRLVYADWLEENGQALRAEFIRLQIKLAATDPAQWQYADVLRDDELLHGRSPNLLSELGNEAKFELVDFNSLIPQSQLIGELE